MVTIKQTCAVVGGVTAHSMKYRDHNAVIFYSFLTVALVTCCVWESGCRVCGSLFSSSRGP